MFEKAKSPTISMATFHDNKQGLYGIFHYVLATTKPLQKLQFSFLQHMHIVSS